MEYLFGVIWRSETSSVLPDIIPHLVRHMDKIETKCLCLKLTAEKDIKNFVQWSHSHKCLEAARNHNLLLLTFWKLLWTLFRSLIQLFSIIFGHQNNNFLYELSHCLPWFKDIINNQMICHKDKCWKFCPYLQFVFECSL